MRTNISHPSKSLHRLGALVCTLVLLVATATAQTVIIDSTTRNGSFEYGSGSSPRVNSTTFWTVAGTGGIGTNSGTQLKTSNNWSTQGSWAAQLGYDPYFPPDQVYTILQDTGYTVASGDAFTLSFDYGTPDGGWTLDDEIEYRVYTAAGSSTPILSGAVSGFSKTPCLLSTGPISSALITGVDVGQPLIVEFNFKTVANGRFARIDNVRLIIGIEEPPAPDDATIISPCKRNGSFELGSGGSPRTAPGATASWIFAGADGIGTNTGSQLKTSSNWNTHGTWGAQLGSGLTILQNTGHLVKSGDVFTLSFDYAAYTTNWTATDKIEYYVYTAAGSATPILSGALTTSGTTKLSTGNLTSSAITGVDVGQPLIVEFNYNTVGTYRYGRIDKVMLTVVSGSGPTGYAAWATSSQPFDGDANGDGVKDGIAFLLGAANPAIDATGLLPTVIESGGNLVLNFNCLPIAARGNSILKVAHSTNLTAWTPTVNVVPDTDTDNAVPDNNVTFVVDTVSESPLNKVTATISSAAAAGGDKLFGRLEANE